MALFFFNHSNQTALYNSLDNLLNSPLSNEVPFTSPSAVRLHKYNLSLPDDTQEEMEFCEFYLPGNGQCGFYGMGLDTTKAMVKVYEKVNDNPLIAEMVYQDMKCSFIDGIWSEDDEGMHQRFSFDEAGYNRARESYRTALSDDIKEDIIRQYYNKNKGAYLRAHTEGLLNNQSYWYLLTPNSPVRDQNEQETYRLLTAVAESHDLKVTIFGRHHIFNSFNFCSSEPLLSEQAIGIFYCWKTKESLRYRKKINEGPIIEGSISKATLGDAVFDEISSQENLLRNKPQVYKHIEAKGHDDVGRQIYVYESTGYKAMEKREQKDLEIYLLNRNNHFSLLIPNNAEYAENKTQAIKQESLFLAGKHNTGNYQQINKKCIVSPVKLPYKSVAKTRKKNSGIKHKREVSDNNMGQPAKKIHLEKRKESQASILICDQENAIANQIRTIFRNAYEKLEEFNKTTSSTYMMKMPNLTINFESNKVHFTMTFADPGEVHLMKFNEQSSTFRTFFLDDKDIKEIYNHENCCADGFISSQSVPSRGDSTYSFSRDIIKLKSNSKIFKESMGIRASNNNSNINIVEENSGNSVYQNNKYLRNKNTNNIILESSSNRNKNNLSLSEISVFKTKTSKNDSNHSKGKVAEEQKLKKWGFCLS